LLASILTSLAVLTILPACEVGDKSGTQSDIELARSLLIERADFPSGWVEADPDVRAVDQPGGPVDLCGVDDGRTARTVSAHFHTGPLTGTISETVSVYESVKAASNASSRSDEMVACAAEMFDEGAFDDSEFKVSNGRFDRIERESLGESQLIYVLRGDGELGGGDSFPVNVTILTGSEGRIAYVLVLQLSIEPSEDLLALLEDLARVTVAGVEDATE
jgi:hypothetical protein